MNLIIELYILVCVMLLLFNIGFLIVKNAKNNKYYPKNNKFKEIVEEEFKLYKEHAKLSNEFKDDVSNKINKTKNLVVLQNALEELKEAKEEISLELRPYVFKEIKNYMKKSDYEQAYYTYVISQFNYDKHKAEEGFCSRFIVFLNSQSLYTFANTMNAIYRFGDHNIMVLAVKKISERDGFYHKKLFIDGLLTFRGDYEELKKILIEKFYTYSPSVQESLIDYFRLKNIDAVKLCIDILNNRDVEVQVIYSAMRYFSKHPNRRSKEIFINILEKGDVFWIEEMLAIQGLSRYKDGNIVELIKSKVINSNWYVRSNASSYLRNQSMTKKEIYNIVKLKDRYANEALLYQYKDDRSVSDYIIKIIEELKVKEIKSKDIEVATCGVELQGTK